jgi:hypothetical protein
VAGEVRVRQDGRGPTRTGDRLGVNEVLWPTELRARGLRVRLVHARERAGARAKWEAGRVLSSAASGRRRAVRIAAGVAVAVLAVLVGAQLLGPAIAAKVVRAKVDRYGSVRSVSVKAWPAVKLVWREADEVSLRAGELRLSEAQAQALLGEARGTETVRVSAEGVELGGLRLQGVRLEKHGSAVRGEGVMSAADVKRSLPAGVAVALVRSEGGTVEVRASGGLFGVSTSFDAVAQAEDGKLVARPVGLLGVLKLTLFESASVYVEGVQAKALRTAPGEGARYELSIWGRLR